MGGYQTIFGIPTPDALQQIGGYKLKFMENFYNLDLDKVPYSQQFHNWVNGIWFDNPPVLVADADIQASDGVGTLTWHKSQIPSYNTTIRTMENWRFGYFEASLRFDDVEGSWPAFWLLSSESINDNTINSGEFDVMEWMSDTPTQCFYNFHKWFPGGQEDKNAARTVTFDAPKGFSFSDYHTYAILWTPGQVDCYIDNQHYGSAPVDSEIEAQNYYIMIGSQAGLAWNDEPDVMSQIPSEQIQVQVQWVRVWQQSE